MEGFGFWKLMLLLVIVVLVFGTAKLPKIGEDLGKAVRSFKKAMHEGDACRRRPRQLQGRQALSG